MIIRSLLWMTAALVVGACSKVPETPDDTKIPSPALPANEAAVKLPFDPTDANAVFSARLEIRAYQRPIPGATVEFAGKTYTSDASGLVTIEGVPVKDAPAGHVTMGGFMPRSIVLSYAAAGSKTLRVFLFPEGKREKISAVVGGTVKHGPGGVTLTANSIVDANGTSYVGDVVVGLRGTPIKEFVTVGANAALSLADSAEADMLPGGFGFLEASDGGLQAVIPVVSMQVELTDAKGNSLQLRAGSSASVEFGLESGNLFPDSGDIDMLAFDEARQQWTQDGTCTVLVQAGKKTCVGTVTHFSTYAIGWKKSEDEATWCGRFVPVFVGNDARPAARLTQIRSYFRIGNVDLPIEFVSNDGKTFISLVPDVSAEFRFKLLDSEGKDVGDELSYRLAQGGMLKTALTKQAAVWLSSGDADSLKTTPRSVFNHCSRLVVPIPLSAATPVVDLCKDKCDSSTEFCVEKDGSCIPKQGTCPSPCGANASCVAATACVCNAGYFADADGNCVSCSSCPRYGQFEARACTPARDTECAWCRPWSPTLEKPTCRNVFCTFGTDNECRDCPTGQYEQGASCVSCVSVPGCVGPATCTSATSSQCTACDEGRYLVDGVADECRACTAVANCKSGKLSCTSSGDSLCLECEPGFLLSTGTPSECASQRCLVDQHVVNNVCVACAAGTTRAAGDDPAGANTSCASAPTVVDFGTAPAGSDRMNFAGSFLVRAVEFGVQNSITISSITVSGLPPQMANTAKLWRKTGAIDLQVTDTYALGTPYSPSSSTATTATFTFASPLVLPTGIYSIALSVEDTVTGNEWVMREFPNTGQYVTAGSITLGPLGGWYGDLNSGTNTATTVQLYGAMDFQVPKVAFSIVP